MLTDISREFPEILNPNFSRLTLRFGHFRLQIRILHAEISQETDSEVWTPDSGLRFSVYPFWQKIRPEKCPKTNRKSSQNLPKHLPEASPEYQEIVYKPPSEWSATGL